MIDSTDQLAPAAQPSARFARGRRLRWMLVASAIDGVFFSIMVGVGETYLPAYAAKLGYGRVWVGLVATLPMIAGALLQLLAPALVRSLGSNRRAVTLCTTIQTLSLIALALSAFAGRPSLWLLFTLATMYWAAGLGTSPPWTDWMGHEIPPRLRPRYYGRRSRWCQAGTLAGLIIGGVTLQRLAGDVVGAPQAPAAGAWVYGLLFLAAAFCRAVSTVLLASQPEHLPLPHDTRAVSIPELASRFRHGTEARLLAYLFALQTAANLAQPFFNPYILKYVRVDYAQYAALLAAAFAAKMIVFPALGRAAARFGPRRLLIWAGVGLVPLPLAWMWSDTFATVLATQLVSGAIWSAYELASFLMLYSAIRPSERTSVLSVYTMGNSASIAAGSVIGGWLLATGETPIRGYLIVFGLSALARAATLPLLSRVRPLAAADLRVSRLPEVAIEPVAVRPATGSLDQAEVD